MSKKILFVDDSPKRYPTKYELARIFDVILKDSPHENLKVRYYKEFNKNKKITFTTLGGVNLVYKGYKYILEAIATLVKEGYNLIYYIVKRGDNSCFLSITQNLGLADRVIFLSKLPHI